MADTGQVVLFTLDNERYGVHVEHVSSVEPYTSVTRVPRAPIFVKGIVNLRGSIVPIIDLRERFGFHVQAPNEESRLMVAEVDDMQVALLVDSVEDVTPIHQSSVETAPAVVGGVDPRFVDGVSRTEEHFIILLNLSRVLSQDEAEALKHSDMGVAE